MEGAPGWRAASQRISESRFRDSTQHDQNHSANPAALAVDRKFTASLFSQPHSSSVAPSRLSKKRPKTAPARTHREQSPDRRAGPRVPAPATTACRNHAGQRAGQAHGAIPARLHRAQGRNHARPAAKHLPDLRGNCVCRGFSQRGQRQSKQRRLRDDHDAEASGNPTARYCTGPLDTSAAKPRLAATCDADRPIRLSAVPSRSFFARPTCVAAKASTETASVGIRAVCHGCIGEHGGGKHEAGRDRCARCRCRRRGRPQPPGNKPQQRAQPDRPNRHGSRLGRPRKAGKQHIRAREGQHRKQHQLRLPGQFFLSHASSYPVAAARKRYAVTVWPAVADDKLSRSCVQEGCRGHGSPHASDLQSPSKQERTA